ncbi:MAG: imidazoleglycerol-phosphate dehydratase HisB [Armatimonadota bacterium]|nr:imidazoleglycerol-phosphate dehydratase HisB [Armatimonadota bacterium]MDR7440036.1 imidazoleglycerol-phosphate dehydratase HisB [Armatimonadota bacterium]MDR7562493.1 imidazoleglycerol-phosphate dehydratase HisB [Armatimonadota bacterium]MDR7566808.1 imidazoleglycerol-phosphate dehydratase HisB [Armatimonadota bacterium]MDR7601377.1 imidazoleglycerol-phosphate dehydratase HisB [Armatimonadota bacterium]
MREAEAARTTAETRVRVHLRLDGIGEHRICTNVPFLDHLLAQWARHGRFDLTVEATGDLEVDAHHTVEDVGIVLGAAFRQALGDGAGIARFSSLHAAMDEALVLCAVDISGRSYLHYDVRFPAPYLGSFSTELVEEFWRAFVSHARITLHLVLLHGRNTHHIAEALFKGCGVVLGQAVRVVGGGVPSTKGVL